MHISVLICPLTTPPIRPTAYTSIYQGQLWKETSRKWMRWDLHTKQQSSPNGLAPSLQLCREWAFKSLSLGPLIG